MGLRKEWEDKARREGETRGEARGRAELLLKQLRLELLELPESAVQRVRSASVAELDRWGERLLSVETLDELWG